MRITHLATVLASLGLLAGCGSDITEPDGGGVPGPVDTSLPFPIDRGGDGVGTPVTYKGLDLVLADNGEPAVTEVDGLVGVICVGMSNARQECGAFMAGVQGSWSGDVDPGVRVVNCAVGGYAIERWNDPVFDGTLWDGCKARVRAAGMGPEQVRVVLHKAANQFGIGPGGSALPTYPDPSSDYFAFERNLATFATRVPQHFPAVQAVYSTSRSYGGFTDRVDRGEPLSYEEGHALNTWLRDHPTVAGVWYGWGPYIWAPDCATSVSNGAGICYDRGDFRSDGIHPSASGEAKIAALWHDRLLEHRWYRR